MIVLTTNRPRTKIRAQAPSVGNPLADPEREDRGVDREPDVRHADEVEQPGVVADREEELVDGRDRQERERGTDPDRVAEPVEDGVDGGHEAPPREPRPDVGTALLRERRPELRDEKGVRHEERDGEEDEPGEALRALGGDDAERVDADDRADEEEVDVEAREVLLELRLLLERHRRRCVDELVRAGDRAHVSSSFGSVDVPANRSNARRAPIQLRHGDDVKVHSLRTGLDKHRSKVGELCSRIHDSHHDHH